MQEEKWREGAAALEEWFKTAVTIPNSAAYYLLAVAYYQQEDFTRALAPAKKAVELMESQAERELAQHAARRCICNARSTRRRSRCCSSSSTAAPDKKTYWMQLSSVYGQMEDYSERARDHAAREQRRAS